MRAGPNGSCHAETLNSFWRNKRHDPPDPGELTEVHGSVSHATGEVPQGTPRYIQLLRDTGANTAVKEVQCFACHGPHWLPRAGQICHWHMTGRCSGSGSPSIWKAFTQQSSCLWDILQTPELPSPSERSSSSPGRQCRSSRKHVRNANSTQLIGLWRTVNSFHVRQVCLVVGQFKTTQAVGKPISSHHRGRSTFFP